MTAEPTNPERADRANQLLVTYAIREMRMDELLSTDTAETLLTDLLADFMHFAAQKNMDFQNCCALARIVRRCSRGLRQCTPDRRPASLRSQRHNAGAFTTSCT
jgi:hypothetical protein